ncbi:MAG: hypothetical protein A2754_01285 [Candidatus Magasanikbacteria bacterium RIFCSPHIGHO2_01_FULL_47_8]|uniref:Uncharacterized protein n=1 Tax=Candidatus Magasanikbacteria bacterium RIFCSPHIGHO2_01_FULL_47_8 TaxID=1798673 RepID=A0A1F6MDC8_9BACT|nr:MAG: hypothetical protein A2754_01285 [Candidatus Magasanikbacteria bacterium RIFCSPHIGHO2_01_FULL_47_8]
MLNKISRRGALLILVMNLVKLPRIMFGDKGVALKSLPRKAPGQTGFPGVQGAADQHPNLG